MIKTLRVAFRRGPLLLSVIFAVYAGNYMAVGGSLVFAPELSGGWRMAAAAGFCGFAGLVPSSLFSEAPHRVPHPAFLATVRRLLVQGAAIGQLLMPPLAAAAVAWYGSWSAGISFMLIGSSFVAACAFALSRTEVAP